MKIYFLKTVLSFFLVAFTISHSQISDQFKKYRSDNLGDRITRKRGIADGNKIRTLFFNDGQVGYWEDRPSMEWPKGTNQCYLDGSSLLFGAEFIAPGNSQVIHSVAASYREEVDVDPVNNKLWILEPIPGYVNQNSSTPAISNLPDTWPAKWPTALDGTNDSLNGKWYGINKNSQANGDFETFFVMDDSQDFEFSKAPYYYYPIPSDSKRGGMGLRIEARIIASSAPQLEDVLFCIYDIYNISDFNYSKAFFGLFVDSGVGGLNDGGDDSANNLASEDLCYFYDSDGIAQPGNWKTGYFGTALLETPKNNTGSEVGLGTLVIERLSNFGPNSLFPKNDEVIWTKMSQTTIDTSLNKSNIVSVLGTKIFEFKSGQSQRLVTAFVLGENLSDLVLNKASAAAFYRGKFSLESFRKIPVTIENLSELNVLKGNTTINWTTSNYPSQDLTSVILISSDGANYYYYQSTKGNSGKLIFETANFPDGIFYKIKIVCYNKTEYGEFISPNYITINNDGNASPQLKFVAPATAGSTLRDQYKIEWLSGDADSDAFNISLYYGLKETNKWELIQKNMPSEKKEFLWSTKLVPNGNGFTIKAVLKSSTDSSVTYSESFNIKNDRKLIDGRLYADVSKVLGTGEFLISIVEPSQISSDEYSVKFIKLADSTTIGYQIVNKTKQKIITEPTKLIENLESNLVDGFRVIVNDDKRQEIISTQSKWVSGNSNYSFYIQLDKSAPTRNIFQPYDYKLTFYDANVYTTPFTKQLINVKVKNIIENKDVDCELFDNDKNGKLNAGDDIVLVEYPQGTNFKLSWRLRFSNPINGTPIPPKGNDEYVFVSTKPFRVGDEFTFSPYGILSSQEDYDIEIPAGYKLYQNFPNPFNPSTLIKFTVPKTSLVSIKVYDVLGKEIKILVNKILTPGEYSTTFDARKLSSGIYFYHINAGEFRQTKKMLLLK